MGWYGVCSNFACAHCCSVEGSAIVVNISVWWCLLLFLLLLKLGESGCDFVVWEWRFASLHPIHYVYCLEGPFWDCVCTLTLCSQARPHPHRHVPSIQQGPKTAQQITGYTAQSQTHISCLTHTSRAAACTKQTK